jgi:hypothetical protein
VLEITSKMFDRRAKANFSDTNLKDLVECFAQASGWAQKTPQGASKLARENEAATLLASVMKQTTDGQWSTAVAGGERLLRDFGDTLLVRLMSNESSRRRAAIIAAPEAPVKPSEPSVPKDSDPPKR